MEFSGQELIAVVKHLPKFMQDYVDRRRRITKDRGSGSGAALSIITEIMATYDAASYVPMERLEDTLRKEQPDGGNPGAL